MISFFAWDECWPEKVIQRPGANMIFQNCTKEKISWWLALEHDRETLFHDKMSPDPSLPFSGKFQQLQNQASDMCMIASDGITSTKEWRGHNDFDIYSIQFRNE